MRGGWVDGHQSMIRSVEIANFRCFKQLDVVGLSNSTSSLETAGVERPLFLKLCFCLAGQTLKYGCGSGNGEGLVMCFVLPACVPPMNHYSGIYSSILKKLRAQT